MSFVYIVRCDFADPGKEQAWNEWYSGPKIAQMLKKPHFRSCQRFRRTGGSGRNYLALWTLDSPDAFKTEAYTSDWGFFDWSPYITNWSRDLFDCDAAREEDFAIALGDTLEVLAFDGMSAADAEAVRAGLAHSEPDAKWLPVVGLDRHTPLIGLCLRSDPETLDIADAPPKAGVQRTFYRPISAFLTTGAAAA